MAATSQPVFPPELLESAVAHQRDAVLITEADRVDPGGRRIVFINPAFTTMTGYSAADAIGKTPGITVGEKTDRAALRRIAAAIERKAPVREEVLKYKKDGTPFWVEIDIAPVVHSDGSCRYLVSVMRDITEKKQLQARLVESDRLASLGTLAAGVAHEINNPLAYVMFNLEFAARCLGRMQPPGEAVEDLQLALADAVHGAERVGRIVRDLRTFSRSDPLESGAVELPAILDSCVAMVRHLAKPRARLVCEYGDAPPAQGNASRFAQVFLHLLVNAVQAIPEGNVDDNEVRVRLYGADATVYVEVEDSGEGIAAHVLPRIFDPFFTTKPVGVGTGFGLSIAHGIVCASGGAIEVKSEVGSGSLFRVLLPAAIDARRAAGAAGPSTLTRPARVLIVDDEVLLTRSLTRLMGGEHQVVVAGSGPEALELLARDWLFDLILCDLMMPEMTGVDLYRRLRNDWPGLERRVAFMSGGAIPVETMEFIESVGNPTFDKPLNLSTLHALLREAVTR